MARGGGRAIIRGRQLFKIFRSRGGDYSREAINRGMAIIQGNTVLPSPSSPKVITWFFDWIVCLSQSLVRSQLKITCDLNELKT